MSKRTSSPNTPKRRGLAPFPTSQEILQRIHWDPRLQTAEFVVGYDERFLGRQEKRAHEFPLHGEIPWHRVWTIRLGQTLVWDREKRLNRMDEALELQQAMAPEDRYTLPTTSETEPQEGDLLTHQSHYHDTEDWRPRTTAPAPVYMPARLRVCTYNILFDLYEKEKVHTKQRIPALLETLEQTNADVIGLQEVTSPFLRALIRCPWVRERYELSALPLEPTIHPYGQVVLSRFPIARNLTITHSREKRSLVVVLAFHPTPICVAVVHLTSSRRRQSKDRRTKQLQALYELQSELRQTPGTKDADWLLMGDFNARDNEQQEGLEGAGYTDIWELLYPGEEGYTFVPSENPLAALSSQTQLPGRLDRILVASPTQRLFPTQASHFGTKSITHLEGFGELYPSDHYGLLCTFQNEEETY